MKLQVLIPSDISEAGKQYLRDRGYEIKMGRGLDEDTIIADAQGCDCLLYTSTVFVHSAFLLFELHNFIPAFYIFLS